LLIWFMFLWMGARLMIRGSRAPPKSDMRILPFALASIYAIFFVTLVTVYLGTQTTQLFFLVCGWGEGLLLYGWRDATDTDAPQVVEDRRPYKFRRVLR
jgi:hypothetical protein